MNSVAVSATTQIAPPSHIFPSPVEAALACADFLPTRPVRPSTIQKSRTAHGPIGRAILAQQELAQRKTLRTVMRCENGTIASAKIDLETGEVVPHDYKDYFERQPRPRANPDAPEIDPFWMQLTAPERDSKVVGLPDRSRKKTVNSVQPHLLRILERAQNAEEVVVPTSLRNAVEVQLPSLVTIIEAANSLDMDGNTRGLCVDVLLAMLLHIDIISTAAITNFAGYSQTHSERYASCLRVIVSAFDRKLRGKH